MTSRSINVMTRIRRSDAMVMARPQPAPGLRIGDPMPRITLPLSSGPLFDSWDAAKSGAIRVYWMGALPVGVCTATLVARLAACEASLYVVASRPVHGFDPDISCIVDRNGEFGRAFGAVAPLAVVVDAGDHVAAVMLAPALEDVAAFVERLHAASEPVVVRAAAPVLLLSRVLEADLCRRLIEYWQAHGKVASIVASSVGNIVDADTKRRLDVHLEDPALFIDVRDALVRRVAPAIEQATHVGTSLIETPCIGCYDAVAGGWFRRHRDNTSRLTAHRQFAISINLNPDGEYDGGELRFPEFGRQLYRPAVGCAVVFSSALLHQVNPVTRGRRFGLFTFLSSGGRAAGFGPRGVGP
jgi:predicted 2-oxoglutarate/Fe(II)-dependent dioxygenase YbiX